MTAASANSTSPIESGGVHPSRTTRRCAYLLDALGVMVGVATLIWLMSAPGEPRTIYGVHPMGILLNPLIALPLYGVSLTALYSRARGIAHQFTAAWSGCVLWFCGLAYLLLLGQVLTQLGLTRTEPRHGVLRIAMATLPLCAWGVTLIALDVRRAFRPAWWMSVLCVPLLVALSILTVSERASDWFIGLWRGPMPDDFGGGLTWSIENNDMIELMELVIFGFLALWTLYVAVGAMRRVALDSGPPARDA